MSVLVWADVPVNDLERARRFYSHVLGVELQTPPGLEGTAMAMGEPPSIDLAQGSGIEASTTAGTTIYFGTADLDGMLRRVEEAGGRILQPKQFMGDMIGYIAFVVDTEGNRIGLQQNSPNAPQQG